jgi:NAD(P)H-dependent FMN reductase
MPASGCCQVVQTKSAVWAQAEVRKVLGAMGGRVLEAELRVAHERALLSDDGRLELPAQQSEQLEEILAELVAQAELESQLVAA